MNSQNARKDSQESASDYAAAFYNIIITTPGMQGNGSGWQLFTDY